MVKSLAVSESESPTRHLQNLPETFPVVGMDRTGSASGGRVRADLYICVLGIHSHMDGKEEQRSLREVRRLNRTGEEVEKVKRK